MEASIKQERRMADQDAYVMEVARLFPPQGRWTEDDYFGLPDVQRTVELVDGHLIIPDPPATEHQQSAMALAFALEQFAEQAELGEVLMGPFPTRLRPGLIRQPDILLVYRAHEARIMDKLLDGPPDWVAEVIAPDTHHADENDKLAEYAHAGIEECWLVDPLAATIRTYLLVETAYRLTSTYTAGQTARSIILDGFSIPVEAVIP
jgi:Uma2 family endonuclease